MTGSNRRRAWAGLGASLLLVQASQAQTPAPTAPALPSPSSAPAFTEGQPAPPVVVSPAPLHQALPQASLHFQHIHAAMNGLSVDDARLDYGGMLTIRAPHLTGNPAQSIYDFTSGVYAHANDTTLTAGDIQYSTQGLGSFLARATNAQVSRRPFLIRAPEIDFTPTSLTATHADITTANVGEKPDIELRADRLTVTPALTKKGMDTGLDHIDLRGVSLYLLHTRIVKIRRFQTTVGRAPGSAPPQQQPHPTVGYSSRFGPFLGYGSFTKIDGSTVRYNIAVPLHDTPQFNLSSTQTLFSGPSIRPQIPLPPPVAGDPLAELRLLTTVPPRPLPDGDPLLFHDFLPGGNLIPLFNQPSAARLSLNEQVSYHVPTEGNGMDDLYVTRYPEITLAGNAPLTHVYNLPAPGDPFAFRQFLRRPALYADASLDLGRFDEQPTDADAGRFSASAGLYTRPLLIGPNTVLAPSVTVTANRYTGTNQKYNYTQYSLAVSHFYSDYNAIGLRYIGSSISGSSPFNFDTLNSSSELDARFQTGSRRLAVAGGVAYDLVHSHVIDYTFSVAPALHGFTPVFSYQFFSRSIGVGFTIPGLTF